MWAVRYLNFYNRYSHKTLYLCLQDQNKAFPIDSDQFQVILKISTVTSFRAHDVITGRWLHLKLPLITSYYLCRCTTIHIDQHLVEKQCKKPFSHCHIFVTFLSHVHNLSTIFRIHELALTLTSAKIYLGTGRGNDIRHVYCVGTIFY